LHFQRIQKWINVEPIGYIYDRLKKNRPNSININCAVSETNGKAKFLLNHGDTEMLSGLCENYDQRHIERINYENNITKSYTKK